MKIIQKIAIALLLMLLMLPAQAQQRKRLILLQTSDMHSRIEPIAKSSADKYAGMGGLVRRATLVNQLRQESPNVLLFDCGDFSQGTPYYNLFRGEVEVQLMNQMGYDAVAIGNHEFDFGMDNLARILKMATFPVVSANYSVEGTVLKGLVKPYVVLKRNGLKIGVFGLSPQLEGLVQADQCKGVVFKDPIATANEVATHLRKKEGCDVVICLSHLGFETDKNQLIPQTQYIDVVLGGHSHTLMNKPEVIPNLVGKAVSLQHSFKSGIFINRTDITVK